MAVSERALRWEALLNARDLGGIPAAGGRIRAGAIVRSDALYRLNDAGRAALVAHGVRTVIDMRNPAEVAAKPYAFGDRGVMRRRIQQQTDEMWAPFAGKADRLTFDTAMLKLARPRFALIAKAIADAPDGGVLIHCEVGKDRTGLMTMVLLDLVGTPVDAIASDYTLTAAGLAPLFADLFVQKTSEVTRHAVVVEERVINVE